MVCKLDTGANCCVISKQDVLSLPRKTHQACRATLTSFFGHKTTAQFKVKLSLSVNDKQHDETFFVIEQNVPVTLSGAAAESLGLIYRIDSVETQQLYPAAQPFADVFTGLGQLKNFEYDMKLKPGAAGVVVPARRVPVAIEEKVKAELQRMEEQNVITKLPSVASRSSVQQPPTILLCRPSDPTPRLTGRKTKRTCQQAPDHIGRIEKRCMHKMASSFAATSHLCRG